MINLSVAMEDLDEILEKAEGFIKEAEKYNAKGDDEALIPQAVTYYAAAIYRGIRALYEQNKALIKVLRERP